MAGEREDAWQSLFGGAQHFATEAEYEHGYRREIRSDLVRFVTFRIQQELYALPILSIVEITRAFVTTPVPRTRDWVIGIGNVRGTVIPVLELARRLRLPVADSTRATRVLVVTVDGEQYGLRVDEVLEVVAFAPEELEDAPGGLGSARADFVAALGRRRGRIVIVLSLAAVVDADEMVDPRHRVTQANGAGPARLAGPDGTPRRAPGVTTDGRFGEGGQG